MSVLACNRFRCDNIMCDRLILKGSHYICHYCYRELLVYKATWKQDEMTADEVKPLIEEFMRTEPGTYSAAPRGEGIDEEFKRQTGEWNDT